MKIIGQYDQFARALRMASIITIPDSETPTFSHVKLETALGATAVIVTAQNQDFQMSAEVPVDKIVDHGAVLLPANLIHKIFSDVSDGRRNPIFTFASDCGTYCKIGQRNDMREFVISALDIASYQAIELDQQPLYQSMVTVGGLFEAVALARSMTARDLSAEKLAGMALQFETRIISAVGSDGRGMGYAEITPRSVQIAQGLSEIIRVLPQSAVDVLVKAIQANNRDYKAAIQVQVGPSLVMFRIDDNTVLATRVISDSYISWPDLIPTTPVDASFEVRYEDIVGAISRAENMNGGEPVGVTLKIDPTGMQVSSTGKHGTFSELILPPENRPPVGSATAKVSSDTVIDALKGVPHFSFLLEVRSGDGSGSVMVTPTTSEHLGGMKVQVWAQLAAQAA